MISQIRLRKRFSQRLRRMASHLHILRHPSPLPHTQALLPTRLETSRSAILLNFKQPVSTPYKLTGDIRFHPKFPSRYLEYQRDIIVYLPPGYQQKGTHRYPVLYMHDGNNIFDPRTSFAGVPWAVNDTVEQLISQQQLQEIIVVGIYNTPARLYEYTWDPMEWEKNEIFGGHGKKYARFVVDELKPYIDKHYRTLSDRENTAVIGSSLGGLISFYLGCHYGDIFSKIGMMSPSFWWGDGAPLHHVARLRPDLKIWMDMGALESGSREPQAIQQTLYVTRLMRKGLLDHGYRENENFMYYEDSDGFHDERSWGRRIHRPLLFFFKR